MNQTQKDKQSYKTRKDRARQAEYEECAKDPPPKTWSATHPAYCFTGLCPDPRYRPKKDEGGADAG